MNLNEMKHDAFGGELAGRLGVLLLLLFFFSFFGRGGEGVVFTHRRIVI
jgi:hypothetical protein